MAETAHGKKNNIESPAGYNGSKGPSPADLNMPTKTYPGSANLGKGAENAKIIEGPCSQDRAYHK